MKVTDAAKRAAEQVRKERELNRKHMERLRKAEANAKKHGKSIWE